MSDQPKPTRRQLEVLRLVARCVNSPLGRTVNNPSGYRMMDTMRQRGWIESYPSRLTDQGARIIVAADRKRRRT